MGRKRKPHSDDPDYSKKANSLNASDSIADKRKNHCLDEDSSEDGDNSSQELTVDVDFEFSDPKEDDFHGVKPLLRTYLDDMSWNLSGFVEIILAQTTVGTVIKTAGDENPFGIFSVLNLGRYKEHLCMAELEKFLRRHGRKKPEFAKLECLLADRQDVGLIVSERVVNLPLMIAYHAFEALFNEIEWATEDEPTDILRSSFKFKHYIILSRVFEEAHPKKLKKKHQNNEGKGELVFLRPEDEIFLELSSWSFRFPMRNDSVAAHQTKGLKLMGLVMAIPEECIPAFRSKLQSYVSDGDE